MSSILYMLNDLNTVLDGSFMKKTLNRSSLIRIASVGGLMYDRYSLITSIKLTSKSWIAVYISNILISDNFKFQINTFFK